MKKSKFKVVLTLLLTLLACFTLLACNSGGGNDGDNGTPPGNEQNPPSPPAAKVETDYFTYTFNNASNGYTVKGTELAKSQTELTVPDTVEGYKVVMLESYAFNNFRSLQKITLSNNITSFGTSVFNNCESLTSINIPTSLSTMRENAFSGCTLLDNITLPAEMRSIGKNAFTNCSSLSSINIPSGLTRIMMKTFQGCTSLTRVTIPETVTKIDNYAFSGCTSLTEVILPKALDTIGTYAFSNCVALNEILFPRVPELVIDDYAFAGSGLLKVYLPEGVVLGTYVFQKLAWDETIENPGDPGSPGASLCTAVYFESATGHRGVQAFGYTWNRPDLGFRIYVPTGSLAHYETENPGDEAWYRCVVNSVNSVGGQYRVLEEYDIDEVFPDGFPVRA